MFAAAPCFNYNNRIDRWSDEFNFRARLKVASVSSYQFQGRHGSLCWINHSKTEFHPKFHHVHE
jgi:hypothetical protein